jgi:DeoR family fructose operon transcriptional repressor
MFSDERKMKILHQLGTKQSVTVLELADNLHVSESTIRRDLQDLEEQGQLKRTHGGAVAKEVASFEPSLQEKVVHHPQEKSAIAHQAVSLIEEGETILLDSGTTTLEIAKALPDIGITVVTNSQQIGQEISSLQKARLLFLGGELRPTTGSFVGPLTELLLSQINVDKLFLGANAVELNSGVTTPNTIEAATKKAMIRSAREVFLVADHSKLGQISLVKVCDFADLDGFLTDAPVSEDYASVFERNSVKFISDFKEG